MSAETLQLHPKDTVAIQMQDGAVPRGHKIALIDIAQGEPIIKYGQVIAIATKPIAKGEHVHVHNVRNPEPREALPFTSLATKEAGNTKSPRKEFQGYKRADGSIGIRNYIAVVATVNCSASVVKAICRKLEDRIERDDINGVVPITHAYGCGQTLGGIGHATLNRTLAGWIDHPNVVASVVIGLGCEGTTLRSLEPHLTTKKPLFAFDIQKVGGTPSAIAEGVKQTEKFLAELPRYARTSCPVDALKLALNCGGSDGFSSLTANPALGVACDLIAGNNGAVVLGEIPECQGADVLLKSRAADDSVREKLDEVFEFWETYSKEHHADLNSNLSPGNVAGGLSTIVEKSLGAVSKAGRTRLNDVVDYSSRVTKHGFTLMNTPGFDPVSVTGLVAGGCQIVAFTTGRGSVYGSSIAPTIKVATNSELARKMKDDIDFDAGRVISAGASIPELGAELYSLVLDVASGAKTKSEELGMGWEEFTPWPVAETL